jgi:hypothetical protein
LDSPAEAEQARVIFREFFRQLICYDEYVSFVFVTGSAKYIKGCLFASFNIPSDISQDIEYAALAGFIHDKIKHYYSPSERQVPKGKKLAEEELLAKKSRCYKRFVLMS